MSAGRDRLFSFAPGNPSEEDILAALRDNFSPRLRRAIRKIEPFRDSPLLAYVQYEKKFINIRLIGSAEVPASSICKRRPGSRISSQFIEATCTALFSTILRVFHARDIRTVTIRGPEAESLHLVDSGDMDGVGNNTYCKIAFLKIWTTHNSLLNKTFA